MPNFEQTKPVSKEKPRFIDVKTQYGFEKEKGPKWEAGAETSSSEDHPDRNEDAYFVDPRRRVIGIFDGVGGRSAGQIASHEAGDIIHRHLSALPPRATAEEIKKDLAEAMANGHEKILDTAKRRPEFEGMATTASVGKIINEGGKRKLVFAHIGDSRIYIARANGSLKQVTNDDSVLNYALEKAKKEDNQKEILKLEKIAAQMDEVGDVLDKDVDPDLRFFFINRNRISAGLGVDANFAVKTGEIELAGDDIVLFTSDGIHDNLTKDQIAGLIKKYRGEGAQRVSEALVEAANEVAAGYDSMDEDSKKKRPKRDDKTAVLLMEEISDMTEEAKEIEE